MSDNLKTIKLQYDQATNEYFVWNPLSGCRTTGMEGEYILADDVYDLLTELKAERAKVAALLVEIGTAVRVLDVGVPGVWAVTELTGRLKTVLALFATGGST